MTNRLAVLSSILAGALVLSACANTVRGVGRDLGNTVDATGAAVNDVAQ
jgi:predicted small secreted protein